MAMLTVRKDKFLRKEFALLEMDRKVSIVHIQHNSGPISTLITPRNWSTFELNLTT